MTDFEINGLVLKLEEKVVSKFTNFKEERKINDTRISFSGFFYIVDLLRGKTLEYKEEFKEEFDLLGIDMKSLFVLNKSGKESKDILTLMSKTETVIPKFDFGEKDTNIQEVVNDCLNKLDQPIEFDCYGDDIQVIKCYDSGLRRIYNISKYLSIINSLDLNIELRCLPEKYYWKNIIIENIRITNGYNILFEYPKEFIRDLYDYSYKTKEEKLHLSRKGFRINLNLPILEPILLYRSRINYKVEITFKKMSYCVEFNDLAKFKPYVDLETYNYIGYSELIVNGLRGRHNTDFSSDLIKYHNNYIFKEACPKFMDVLGYSRQKIFYTVGLTNPLLKNFTVIITDKYGNGIDCLESVCILSNEDTSTNENVSGLSKSKEIYYPIPLSNLSRRIDNLPKGYYTFKTNLDIRNITKLPEDTIFRLKMSDESIDLKVGVLIESVSFIKYFRSGDVSNVFC